VLDGDAPAFVGSAPADTVDRWLFNGNRNLVREVHVGGTQSVHEGRHRDREKCAARFATAMRTLLA